MRKNEEKLVLITKNPEIASEEDEKAIDYVISVIGMYDVPRVAFKSIDSISEKTPHLEIEGNTNLSNRNYYGLGEIKTIIEYYYFRK